MLLIAFYERGELFLKNRLQYLLILLVYLFQIDDNTFQGLNNLETLFLEDNNILLIPASTLNQLVKLKGLKLGYNRITAVSAEILAILSNRLTDLGLGYNVIRELPSYAFQVRRVSVEIE